MCRSAGQGGRRCPTSRGGHRARTSTSTTTSATTTPWTPSVGGAPSREQTDAMAAAHAAANPDVAGWDGTPLSAKDRRLYAVREAGYRGPVDHDGYPHTTGVEADALRRMTQRRGEAVTW